MTPTAARPPRTRASRLESWRVVIAVFVLFVLLGACCQAEAAVFYPRPSPAGATTADDYWTSLTAQKATLCVVRERTAKTPSAATAISRSWAMITKRQGAKRVAALKAWLARQSVAKAVDDGTAAQVAARPDAALAVFLLLHQRDPRNPQHLANAAAVLAGLGYPREALALTKAATATKRTAPTAVGVTGGQALQTVVANAWFQLGLYKQASATYAAAWSANHELVEAAQGVVGAAACRGDKATALAWAGRARVRNFVSAAGSKAARTAPAPALANPTYDSLPTGRLTDDDHFTPWDVQVPTDTAQIIALRSYFQQQANTDHRQDKSFATEYAKIATPPTTTAAGRWHHAIMDVAFSFGDPNTSTGDSVADAYWRSTYVPASRGLSDYVKPLIDGTFGSQGTLGLSLDTTYHDCIVGSPDDPSFQNCLQTVYYPQCRQKIDGATQLALSLFQTYDHAAKGYQEILQHHASRLARLTTDPHLRKAIMLSQEGDEGGQIEEEYQQLYQLSWDVSMYSACYTEQEAPAETPATAADGGSALGCPSWLGFSLSIGIAEMSVSCDSQEITLSSGPIGTFVQVSHNSRKNTVTIFSGGQISAGAVVSATGRAGAYVTVDSSGNISDVGLRATLDYTGSVGPVQATSSTEIDAGLANGLAVNPD